jgi:hypothetical protein
MAPGEAARQRASIAFDSASSSMAISIALQVPDIRSCRSPRCPADVSRCRLQRRCTRLQGVDDSVVSEAADCQSGICGGESAKVSRNKIVCRGRHFHGISASTSASGCNVARSQLTDREAGRQYVVRGASTLLACRRHRRFCPPGFPQRSRMRWVRTSVVKIRCCDLASSPMSRSMLRLRCPNE